MSYLPRYCCCEHCKVWAGDLMDCPHSATGHAGPCDLIFTNGELDECKPGNTLFEVTS